MLFYRGKIYETSVFYPDINIGENILKLVMLISTVMLVMFWCYIMIWIRKDYDEVEDKKNL